MMSVIAAISSNAVAGNAKIPSLTGTWAGSSEAAFLDALAEVSITLVVTEQSGPNFRGYFTWITPRGTNTKGRTQGEEKIAGVVEFDGKDLVIAEEIGGGVMRGRLIAPNTMQIVKWQASSEKKRVTMAQRLILTRK